MVMSDKLSEIFAANYPRENTVCLPPGAVARLERGGISDVAVSPDENLIAIASRLGVWLYDAHTKDFVSLIAVEGTGLLSKVVFSPDGTRIAAGDWDGKTTLWDIKTETTLTTYIHKDYINSIIFSPNGKFIAISSRDGTATLWDVETGTACFTITHQGSVTSTTFSPDGTLLATGSSDATATLWHIDTEEIRWTFTHERQEKSVTFDSGHVETFNRGGIGHIAFSPDGQYLATAGQRMDYSTILWDVETGEQLWCVTHEKPIDAVAFSPDGTSMATYYEDDTVSILRVADGILIPRAIHAEKWRKTKRNLSMDHDKDGWGRRVRFSPDGKHLAELKMAGNSLILWDVNTGEKIKELDGVKGAARTFVFSPEGHCLGLSCTAYPEYDTVELWDEEKRASFTHSGHVDTVAMSPDGTFLATGGRDKTVKLWHVETQQRFHTLSGHIGRILSLTFSPDGSLLVSGGGDNWEKRTHADGTTSFFSDGDSPIDRTAKVWEVATGENIATLETSGMVRGAAFSPDGKCLATGASNKTVTLWCPKTWQPMATLDTVSFESFAFSPDGSQLVIGGTWPEQRIQIWDVETRELIVELSGHKSDVESLAFSPDSRLLASGGFDGIIYLWDMTPYL